MLPALSDTPPGLNSPYGPYGGIPSGNPANSGLAPPSGINTENPILDLVLNTVFAGVMGDTPMLRTFGRPKVSDYSYTSMQERQRVSQMATPDVIAANPMFGSMISGDLGKNRYFQQLADSMASPGGSMGDAFNTVYGRFTKDLAGPGLRNASTNAILAANIVKNTDKAFLDKNGMYDYRKTYGFDRAQTYRNADAYNRVFGGFTGSVDTRDETDRAVEMGTLSQTVLEEAERRGDITPEKAQDARQKIQVAESRLQESRNIAPTEMSDFVGKSLQDVGSQLGVTPANTPPAQTENPQTPSDQSAPEVPGASESSGASEVPVQSETKTGFVDTSGAPYVPPSNFPTIAPFYDVPVDSEDTKASEIRPQTDAPLVQPETPEAADAPALPGRPETADAPALPERREAPTTETREAPTTETPTTATPEIEPEEVSEEVKQKRARFDELNKQYQEVKGFLTANKESPEVGVNKVQSDEVERRLDQIVEEITVLDEQKGQERKSEFNSIKRQIKGDVETAVASAQDTYQDVISTYGTPQQQGLAASSLEDRSRGPMADLAEAPTAENAERQEAARNKFLEVNKMTREAENLFGQDLPADELMQSVKGLVEGASGMSTSDVTDLLQRIQATAVVVDMSNEAIVRYFDVLDNMYKGMGVRSGNRANMAQNALLAADASVQARKEAAEARGEMYTGPDTGELAQKFAEYQGKTARSPRNSRAFAYLATLSEDGAEGGVRRELESRLSEGDMEGAMDVITGGIESGSISGDKQRIAGAVEASNIEFGASAEQQEYIKRGLVARYGEEEADRIMGNATGENMSMVSEAAGKQLGDYIFGAGRDNGSAEIINEKLGAGASDKIREALRSGELSGEELKDPEMAKAKLGKMFAGASDSALSDARDQIAGALFAAGPAASDALDVALSAENREKAEEKQQRMKEVKGEINDTIENRAEYMRDLNPVGETFTVAFDTLKRMKDSGVEDFSNPEAIIAAAGGAIGDWAGLTEAQKNQMNAAVEAFSGQNIDAEGVVSYKDEVAKIDQDAKAEGQRLRKRAQEEGGITDTKRLDEIEKEGEEKYKSKEMEELKKSLSDGKTEESGEGGDSEKGAFDSDAALQSLITAIGDVATAIAKMGSDKTASSSGNPDARVENLTRIA